MAFRPETARPLNDLVEVLLCAPNSLSPGERELIDAYVSYLNNCHFCQSIHGAIAAAHLNGDEELVRRVKDALEQLRGRRKVQLTEPVFPALRTGAALQGARGWFPSALEEAAIKGYTWHCNRHTFAGRLVMAGVDLRTVAELLGHRTLQMVMRYSHLALEHQASAVDRLVPRKNQRDTKSDTGRFGKKKAIRRYPVNDTINVV